MKKSVVLLFLISILAACGQSLSGSNTAEVVETAATVTIGDDTFTVTGADVEEISLASLEFQDQLAAEAGEPVDDTVSLAERLEITRPTSLTLAIYSRIIDQQLAERDITLEGDLLAEVNERMQELQFMTDTEFEEFLSDPNQFTQETIGLQQGLLALAAVEDVEPIEATCISHVLRSYTAEERALPDFVADEADDERFQAEAEEARQRIVDGELFEDVAMEVSVDTGSAIEGGSLGCFPTAEVSTALVPEFAEVALASEIGELSEVFESEFGFHFLIITEDEEGIALLQSAEAENVVQTQLQTVLQGATVEVDQSIGAWNPTSLQVEAPLPDVEFEETQAPPIAE